MLLNTSCSSQKALRRKGTLGLASPLQSRSPPPQSPAAVLASEILMRDLYISEQSAFLWALEMPLTVGLEAPCPGLWIWLSCHQAFLEVCTIHPPGQSLPHSLLFLSDYLASIVCTLSGRPSNAPHARPPVRPVTDCIISPPCLCPRSVDHPLPGSSLSTDFGSWQMVTGCGSIQERAVLHTDSSLPVSFPDELPNTCL